MIKRFVLWLYDELSGKRRKQQREKELRDAQVARLIEILSGLTEMSDDDFDDIGMGKFGI